MTCISVPRSPPALWDHPVLNRLYSKWCPALRTVGRNMLCRHVSWKRHSAWSWQRRTSIPGRAAGPDPGTQGLCYMLLFLRPLSQRSSAHLFCNQAQKNLPLPSQPLVTFGFLHCTGPKPFPILPQTHQLPLESHSLSCLAWLDLWGQ